ncbi:hypothetical protein P0Y35_16790 [Kiritimatiellaeota bacterium B1221]|nr:hypothetical protein [Kiritimatiellaeota bacterium B1221]
MKKYMRLLSIGFVPCLLMISSAKGELLVYEGFNYGLSDNTTIHGTLTNATGLSGNYAVNNTTGNASSTYRTSGLSFGSSFFATAGGALNQKASSAAATYAGAAIDTDTVSGDLWGSYLFNYDAVNSVNSTGQVRFNTTATGGSGSSWFSSASDISGTNKYPQISYNGSSFSNQSSFAFVEDTTYLMLMHYSNVGASLSGGDPGVASLCFFFSNEL